MSQEDSDEGAEKEDSDEGAEKEDSDEGAEKGVGGSPPKKKFFKWPNPTRSQDNHKRSQNFIKFDPPPPPPKKKKKGCL